MSIVTWFITYTNSLESEIKEFWVLLCNYISIESFVRKIQEISIKFRVFTKLNTEHPFRRFIMSSKYRSTLQYWNFTHIKLRRRPLRHIINTVRVTTHKTTQYSISSQIQQPHNHRINTSFPIRLISFNSIQHYINYKSSVLYFVWTRVEPKISITK